MPGPRLPVRKIRDVLRLSAAGMSKRQIAVSLGMSATAARDCILRARRAGLAWPLPQGLTDETLEDRLYPPPAVASKERRPRPDWATVHRELRRPGVTLQLLWEEQPSLPGAIELAIATIAVAVGVGGGQPQHVADFAHG